MRSTVSTAFRRLMRHRSYTLPAVSTLAVGVGATTAIFSAVNAAILRPLPYPNSEDLYIVTAERIDGGWSRGLLSNAELNVIESGAPSVAAITGAARTGTDVLIADDGHNRRLSVAMVTDDFFDVPDMGLAIGRASARDVQEGTFGAVVISYRLWDAVFSRDPGIVGKPLRLATGSGTIVGVAAAEFEVPGGTEVWSFFSPSPSSELDIYRGLLRVRPGTTEEDLRAELTAVMASRVRDGLDPGGRAFVATPLVETILGELEPILWIVLSAAVVLLALASANVAALTLARGRAQTREFAVRKALGANRSSIGRQLLTESFLVSALGTMIGLVLAYGGVKALSALGADGMPRLDEMGFDLNVLLFAVVALVVTAVVVSLLPMIRITRTDVHALVGEGGRSVAGQGGSRTVLAGIVVSEIAMSVLLVASAGWLVSSYSNLAETDPGFEPESRLVFRAHLVGSSYVPITRIVTTPDTRYLVDDRSGDTPETWLRDLTTRLQALNQVRKVGLGAAVPFGTDPSGVQYVSVPGMPQDPSTPGVARARFVSPNFLEALGVPLVAGRFLAPSDPPTAVVVNEAFLRTYMPDRDPIGTSYSVGYQRGEFTSERTIVGVVADVRYESLREPDPPASYSLLYDARGFVVISTSLDDPTPLIPAVRAAVAALDPGVPVTIEPLERVMSTEMARHRLGLLLMLLFAVVSLVLAGIGIYGVVGHNLSLRSREFAVRLAVGARRANIVWLILRHGATLWLLGTTIGLILAHLTGRLGSSQLYEVRAGDPVILAAAVLAVSLLTLAAFTWSASKGSRVEPAAVLTVD